MDRRDRYAHFRYRLANTHDQAVVNALCWVNINCDVQLLNMTLHASVGAAKGLYQLISIAFEGYPLTIPSCSGVLNSRYFQTTNVPGQQIPSILLTSS